MILSVKPASPYSTPQSLSTNAESLLETTSRSPSRNGRSQRRHVLVSVLSTRERKRIAGESLWNISFYLRNTTKSMTRFALDEFGNEVPGGRPRRRLVKEFALQKMGEAFRNFKKNLTRDYVNKGKTPDFNGQHEKLKDDWPEFVRQKQSEHFKEISKKIRIMRVRKSSIILWGQEDTAFRSLGGRRWRRT